ncbi:hypothetical protein OUZ56_006123 [Daphnia magna]|uniref:Uncharacterized protein n=1 Tax=Daphnia magna TaxID=35525 RepID=A0ABQ9YUP3_9CRUS|nr:hypothetical protein OUZ56_006123 [Daphnia magna]
MNVAMIYGVDRWGTWCARAEMTNRISKRICHVAFFPITGSDFVLPIWFYIPFYASAFRPSVRPLLGINIIYQSAGSCCS